MLGEILAPEPQSAFRLRPYTIEYMVSPENLFKAMRECCNGVRWKASVQRFEVNKLRWAAFIRRNVILGTFKTKGFVRFDIIERGKLRHIQSVHISERVVQKLLCKHILRPIHFPGLEYDNSASQIGKGTEFAINRLIHHLRWHYERYGNAGAVAVTDFSEFFDSIPHNGAIECLSCGVSDELVRKYIADFINAFDGDVGVGLGSEISQVAAVRYPDPIDKFVKNELGIDCFGRYMDDGYIIHQDRRYVVECVERIAEKSREYGLQLNMKKTKVHNLANDNFVFLKKRVCLKQSGKVLVRLSRENLKAERKRIKHMREEYDAGRMPVESIVQSYKSWRGHAKKYNAYHEIGDMDKLFATVMKGVA